MPRTFSPTSVPPDEALARLQEGNQRFVRGDGTAIRRWDPHLVEGQSPFAVVLGCSDSRAPAEFVFDQGLGDLFVVRVAGPVIAPSLVGSVEFAASEFGTRLVVVMGHTHCGAVGATVNAALGSGPASSNLRSIIDRIAPNLEHLLDAPPAEPAARLDAAVRANALAAARELRHASAALQELVDQRRVVIVSAVYDLETGVVTFHDEPASVGSSSLGQGA
ncbi:MAG: carbonic anhydrase [Polyangiaceae bacterium]